ncbi:MAG: SpoIIE family protein phosphatase [Acidobacteria bacterium]|nr:SpoIIE family protein phosphatase [Acidobacteriota bacterium]
MATRLRVLMMLVFAWVLADQIYFDSQLVARVRNQKAFVQQPVGVDGSRGRRVVGIEQEAADAGVAVRDVVLAVEEEPYTSMDVYLRNLHARKPGDDLRMRVRRPDGTEKDVSIRLRPMSRDSNLWLNATLQLFALIVCIPLAFGVAWMRPNDTRSWVLIWMMVAFIMMFQFFYFYPENEVLTVIRMFMVACWKETWPLSMAMLGLFFPERIKLKPWQKWAAAAPATYAVLYAVLVFVHQFARLRSFRIADMLVPLRDLTDPVDVYFSLTLIGFYFLMLGVRFPFTKTAPERRRLVLLNVGSHLAFTPLFVMVIRSLIRGTDTFQGMPPLVTFVCLLMLMLFPLTLAYLVLVHRAMDIRVVLRTGLQYALASRAINVLRMLLVVGAVVYAMRIMQTNERRVENVTTVAVVILFSVLISRAADRARGWIDRHFFREAYNAEHVLSELSQQLRRILEPGVLVETVSRRIAESLHITHVATLLRDGDGFRPAYAVGFDGTPDALFAGDAPVARRLEESRTPQRVYLDDPESWVKKELAGHRDYDLLAGLQTQLLLPIEGQGELTGFISLGPKRSEEPYSRADVQLLQSVATQAGLALDNTRLTAAVAQEAARRERIHQEMEIAGDVQERLFPQRRPVVEGLEYAAACRPAQSVGGDSFDFLELPEGRFGVSIGDVSGKGIPAAILMAVVQTSIRSNAPLAAENLAAMMSSVNRVVEDASSKKHFATIFFGAYHPHTRELRYVNAAHNPPLLLRANGEAEWLKPTGHAVGWSKRAAFAESAVELQPGDTLFLYTDGITEAMNRTMDEFGEDRFLETARRTHTLHPEAVIPAVLHAIDEFAAGEPQHDDMTMVVLRVRP